VIGETPEWMLCSARALDIRDVFAGAQTLAVGQAQFRPATTRIAGQFVSASLASAARNWQRAFTPVW
jgi:hypothetical protein